MASRLATCQTRTAGRIVRAVHAAGLTGVAAVVREAPPVADPPAHRDASPRQRPQPPRRYRARQRLPQQATHRAKQAAKAAPRTSAVGVRAAARAEVVAAVVAAVRMQDRAHRQPSKFLNSPAAGRSRSALPETRQSRGAAALSRAAPRQTPAIPHVAAQPAVPAGCHRRTASAWVRTRRAGRAPARSAGLPSETPGCGN